MTNTYHSANQYVFITAGGSGIGLAMAKAFLKTGAHVAVTDTNCDALAAAKAALPALEICEADAANPDQMQSAFDMIMDKWGRLDVLMANAGIAGPTASIENVSLDDWRRVFIGKSGWQFPCRQTCHAHHEKPEKRGHHADLFYGRTMGISVSIPLCNGKMGDYRAYENTCHGIGRSRHKGKCYLPRLC